MLAILLFFVLFAVIFVWATCLFASFSPLFCHHCSLHCQREIYLPTHCCCSVPSSPKVGQISTWLRSLPLDSEEDLQLVFLGDEAQELLLQVLFVLFCQLLPLLLCQVVTVFHSIPPSGRISWAWARNASNSAHVNPVLCFVVPLAMLLFPAVLFKEKS